LHKNPRPNNNLILNLMRIEHLFNVSLNDVLIMYACFRQQQTIIGRAPGCVVHFVRTLYTHRPIFIRVYVCRYVNSIQQGVDRVAEQIL